MWDWFILDQAELPVPISHLSCCFVGKNQEPHSNTHLLHHGGNLNQTWVIWSTFIHARVRRLECLLPCAFSAGWRKFVLLYVIQLNVLLDAHAKLCIYSNIIHRCIQMHRIFSHIYVHNRIEFLAFQDTDEQWWKTAIFFFFWLMKNRCICKEKKKSGSCSNKVCSIHSVTNKWENSRCSTN